MQLYGVVLAEGRVGAAVLLIAANSLKSRPPLHTVLIACWQPHTRRGLCTRCKMHLRAPAIAYVQFISFVIE